MIQQQSKSEAAGIQTYTTSQMLWTLANIDLQPIICKLHKMALLKLMRPYEKSNRLAEMMVYLNGRLLGIILNNETKQFEIPAGKHRLKAKIGSQGSKVHTFSIADCDGKVLVIATDNEANSPEPLFTGTFLDVFIGSLQLLYYFTTGHNRYLTISELRAH